MLFEQAEMEKKQQEMKQRQREIQEFLSGVKEHYPSVPTSPEPRTSASGVSKVIVFDVYIAFPSFPFFPLVSLFVTLLGGHYVKIISTFLIPTIELALT